MKRKSALLSFFLTAILLFLPVLLLFQSWWISFNYWLVVPPDMFGLSTQDRMEKAQDTLSFVKGDLSSGELLHTVPYNSRELTHLSDVRFLYHLWRRLLLISLILYLFSHLLLNPTTKDMKLTLKISSLCLGSLTLACIVGILFFWELFFDQFHQLLFEPETWMFYIDDWLIRLFPETFWFSSALLLGLLYLLTAIVLYVFQQRRL